MEFEGRDVRVRFERARYGRNGLNEKVVVGWDVFVSVMVKVSPTSDGERNEGAQVGRVVTERLTMRWNSKLSRLTGCDQAVFDSKVHAIVGIKTIGRREKVEISVAVRPDMIRPAATTPSAGGVLDFSDPINSGLLV